jgi:hypothetical protein
MNWVEPLIGFFRFHLATSMVVDDVNLKGIPISPNKANPPLIVDANTVLAPSGAFQRFQSISRRRLQVA